MVGGVTPRCVSDPDQAWDLVVVHTVHRDTDPDWLQRQACVLDTTYRLDGLRRRELL